MIVITGASNGLGKALAQLYLEDGKRVVGLCRHDPGGEVEFVETDLRDDQALKNAADYIVKQSEALEALINCAGVLSIENVEQLTPSEVNKVLETNVRAPLLLTSYLMTRIKKDGTDIVNVASSVGTKAYIDQAAYGTSKWAIRGFSANLQLELKDFPSRVISFCPGGFTSELFLRATGVDNTTNKDEWMKAEDVALSIKQILGLPKNMEVSEIILNRKVIKP